jgi:hypothetical protein
MLTKDVVLMHDNAHSHTPGSTYDLIKLFNWEVFGHPPDSMDLALSDYHLSTKMKA